MPPAATGCGAQGLVWIAAHARRRSEAISRSRRRAPRAAAGAPHSPLEARETAAAARHHTARAIATRQADHLPHRSLRTPALARRGEARRRKLERRLRDGGLRERRARRAARRRSPYASLPRRHARFFSFPHIAHPACSHRSCGRRPRVARRLLGGGRALRLHLMGALGAADLRDRAAYGRPAHWPDSRRRHHVCPLLGAGARQRTRVARLLG